MIAVYSCNSVQVFRTSTLFGRVVQDATVYFLVIAWVHLTVLIYVSRTIGTVRLFLPPPLPAHFLSLTNFLSLWGTATVTHSHAFPCPVSTFTIVRRPELTSFD